MLSSRRERAVHGRHFFALFHCHERRSGRECLAVHCVVPHRQSLFQHLHQRKFLAGKQHAAGRGALCALYGRKPPPRVGGGGGGRTHQRRRPLLQDPFLSPRRICRQPCHSAFGGGRQCGDAADRPRQSDLSDNGRSGKTYPYRRRHHDRSGHLLRLCFK